MMPSSHSAKSTASASERSASLVSALRLSSTAVRSTFSAGDAIYVIGRAWIHKRFEIYFKRGPGAPFEIALDRTKEGYVPSARRPYTPGTDAADVSTPAPAPDPTPEPVRSPTRTKRPSASQTAAAPATPKVPSATQKIECPVQPSRADCKSFCPGTWSWCK